MVRISDILKKKLASSSSSADAAKPQEIKPQEKQSAEDKPHADIPDPELAKPAAPISPPASEAAPLSPVPDPVSPVSSREEVEKPKEELPKPQEKVSIAQEPLSANPQEMQIAKVMKEVEPDIERSKELYLKALQAAGVMLKSAQDKKAIEIKPIKELVEETVNAFVLGDKTLIALFYDDHLPDEYLSYHIVNAMVMSVALGVKMGLNKMPLGELGLSAFLHDIGMTKFEDIALKPRVLSTEEYIYIKEHPEYGRFILSEVKDIPGVVIKAVNDTHEWLNGEGYPKGLKEGQISDYARIIATVDVYEALTHTRSYRKKFPPYEAIKEMASFGNARFDPKIFKILIDVVGVYPIGSYAQLNTEEIVKVVATNDDFPLRPVVNIIFDADKKRLVDARLVNLAKQFNLYIKKPLSDAEISQLISGA